MAQKIRPQGGPQELFLSSNADVAFYGGAAGGGKTFSLLMEPLRHVGNKDFTAVIFRRTSPQIRNAGGLWDESQRLYRLLGAEAKEATLEWHFPSGCKMKFSHMEHEKNRFDWQGSQIAFIGFDEITHFTWQQFTYMFSRNRSTCGIKPYIRATCNPDPDSWVKDFIAWWLDDDGFAIQERSGVIRWFVMVNDVVQWGDSREDLLARYPDLLPRSFTFINSSIYDNKILLEADPNYLASLQALPFIERQQLLHGNWKVNIKDGIIKREWFRYYRELPNVIRYAWAWDTAIKTGQLNDYSAGQLWAECEDGYYLVERFKDKVEYPELKRIVQQHYDKQPATVYIEDKASGQQLVQDFRRSSRMPVIPVIPGREIPLSKDERLNLCSPLFEAGKVFLPEGEKWVSDYVSELCLFPNGAHDDEVDATTLYLCQNLMKKKPRARVIEW